MYRHFAVVTVGVTLVVGVFADGESRKAVASEVHAAARPRQAGPTELVRHDAHVHGSFASDASLGEFGAPMDVAGATPQDGAVPQTSSADPTSTVPAGFTRYGVSAATWSALTDDQRKALIAKRAAEASAAQAPERAAQISSLLAASRERSGNAETPD